MTTKYQDYENDNYPIGPYDPNLSDEERAKIAAEADRKINEAIEIIKTLK